MFHNKHFDWLQKQYYFDLKSRIKYGSSKLPQATLMPLTRKIIEILERKSLTVKYLHRIAFNIWKFHKSL